MKKNSARLFVIAAPSGAGKTTLVKALVERNPELRFSVSYTTRKRRETEVDGRDYLFVNEVEFLRLQDQGELLESAVVFDNRYATSRSQVERMLAEGHHVILEIDWQGARQVRESMPECISIFILPPSRAELERRLRGRRTDSDEVIARRLRDALGDMSHWDEFDYTIINDDLNTAIAQLEAILAGDNAANRNSNPGLRSRVADIVC
ncbi:MAG: guanylate kinase [Gammaproteobacteria bacterium]|nr:guanylate kinase [Gammaproteobacteria bacterium]MDH4314388.1 guanylate kinase [Gammaproteobacteria bacterium]MDH5213172.1 guanylate kinase [Gammaproteobacteria bacterium]